VDTAASVALEVVTEAAVTASAESTSSLENGDAQTAETAAITAGNLNALRGDLQAAMVAGNVTQEMLTQISESTELQAARSNAQVRLLDMLADAAAAEEERSLGDSLASAASAEAAERERRDLVRLGVEAAADNRTDLLGIAKEQEESKTMMIIIIAILSLSGMVALYFGLRDGKAITVLTDSVNPVLEVIQAATGNDDP